MSTEPHPPTTEEDDLLAAEYVLGLLEGPEWRAARDRASIDSGFAARVQAWEERLAPLNAEFEELSPPDLLPQIEASLFPERRKPTRKGWLWGLGLGTLTALVVLVAVFFRFPPTPPAQPALVAELVEEARGLRLSANYSVTTQILDLRLVGPEADPGQDYELWVIDDSGQPRSLGVLAADQSRLQTSLAEGQILAISLEPEGGSPQPGPTGAVLTTAVLEKR